MDCLNFIKNDGRFIFDSLEHDKYKERGEKIIHWLPKEKGLINVEILMDNGEIKKGFGEKNLSKVRVNDIIQFERFAFCKLDKKTKEKYVFWWTHN